MKKLIHVFQSTRLDSVIEGISGEILFHFDTFAIQAFWINWSRVFLISGFKEAPQSQDFTERLVTNEW